MEEKNLTEQESLRIIQRMINTAKQQQKDSGVGWILWGWLLFIVSMLTYINLQTRWFRNDLFWNIFGVVSLLLILYSSVKYIFFRKKVPARTYTGELFQKLNIGFFISLMFIIIAFNRGVNPIRGFPLLVGLYGFWMLIYGTAFEFKPSIIAAYVTWAIGIASFYADSFDEMMLFHAAAVLLGYIIPGHIAYAQFKKLKA